MGPEVIVVVPPGFEFPAGMGRAGEDRLVQTFVPEPRIEALGEPVRQGLPGAIECHSTLRSFDRRPIAMPVGSVPLSLTIVPGRAIRSKIAASGSQPTLAPEIDVSAIRRTHSRLKSSTTAKIRNLRPQAKASDMKSRLQRWFGPCGNTIGARVPNARLRPPRRQTCKRSSR